MLAGHSIKNLENVLDLAVWLEKHGQEFYQAAMDETDDPKLKELFSYLMEEEKKHCIIYARLYEEQTGREADDEPLWGEYAHFIDLLIREISENLYFEEDCTPKELLWKALRFEKDTLLYFNEIKALFPEESAAIIDSICRQEKKHIAQLMDLGESMQLFFAS